MHRLKSNWGRSLPAIAIALAAAGTLAIIVAVNLGSGTSSVTASNLTPTAIHTQAELQKFTGVSCADLYLETNAGSLTPLGSAPLDPGGDDLPVASALSRTEPSATAGLLDVSIAVYQGPDLVAGDETNIIFDTVPDQGPMAQGPPVETCATTRTAGQTGKEQNLMNQRTAFTNQFGIRATVQAKLIVGTFDPNNSEDGISGTNKCFDTVDNVPDGLVDSGDPDCRFASLATRNTAYSRFPFETASGLINSSEDGAGAGTCYNGIDDADLIDDGILNGSTANGTDAGPTVVPPPDPDCWNGVDGADNDGDTLVDIDDPQVKCFFIVAPAIGGKDWNVSGGVDGFGVKAPINDPFEDPRKHCLINPFMPLIGYNDWPYLLYNVRQTAGWSPGLSAGPVPLGDPGHVMPDADSDSINDGDDNCITTANASQLDTDGDSMGDACDPDDDNDGYLDGVDGCPLVATAWATPSGDGDCDGFTSGAESSITTNPADACGFTPGAPPQSETWPPDLVETNSINISDVLALKPVFGTAVPPTSARYDIVPSGGVNISDVLTLKPFFGTSCTP